MWAFLTRGRNTRPTNCLHRQALHGWANPTESHNSPNNLKNRIRWNHVNRVAPKSAKLYTAGKTLMLRPDTPKTTFSMTSILRHRTGAVKQ